MNGLLTKSRLLLLALCLFSGAAMAQFKASGTVRDANGEALIGATVLIKGTAIGTVTDINGMFEINVPTENAVLDISFTGYASTEITVSRSNANVTVALQDGATQLEEVVITGFATNVKRSNSANAVSTINAAALTGVTSQNTLDGALYGKFQGAEIRANSGAPGGGMSVKLRGVTSIFGDQQPLYIIDGVFLDNSTVSLGTDIVSAAAGGGNTSTNQDDASNRIADIDPEDIENIEILKGASAAAIYGSRAAGGVVIITTKRGQSGKSKVTLSQTVGVITPQRLLGMRDFDAAKIAAEFSQADVDKFNQNGLTNFESELYDKTRFGTTTRADVSGGNDKINFFLGGTYKNEDGILDNTGYEKGSVRLNIGYKFNSWLDIMATNNYINSTADRGFFNNSNTNTTIGYALAFTRPWENLFPDENGVYPAVPSVGSNLLETPALVTNREEVNRYIGGATMNVKFFENEQSSLKAVLRAGVDQYALRTTSIFPHELSYMRDEGTLEGVSVSGNTVNTNTNLSAFLVFNYFTPSGITLRTQAGVTQEDFDKNTVYTTASGLNGSLTNVGQSANVAAFQNIQIQHDKGFFAQQEFNWNDRLVATVGIRGDKSSNNGDPNKINYYPKANLALNFDQFDFWSVDAINAFKLRVAYGEAGRFANFADRFNLYDATSIGGKSGWVNNVLRGNSDVTPERQKELEYGTDISLMDNMVNIVFTVYNKEIDDLLLRAEVPNSSGYTTRVINAGALQNKGIEAGLSISPLKGKDMDWTIGVNFWKNKSEVTRLDIPAFNLGGFAASLGQFRIEEGKSATQIIGTYDPADCDNCDPDGDGFKVYGNAEADFNMSFSNMFAYKGFEFSFLFHWKKGGDNINLSTLLFDLGALTWDYDDVTLDKNPVVADRLPNGQYRPSEWFAGNTGPWIEDAGYLRLREVGLYYNIPRSVFRDAASMRLGVSGRNLINIFDYNSYDPEVSNFGGNVLANNVEVTPFPSSKRVNFHLTLRF